MQIAFYISKIWAKTVHFSEIFTSILTTRDGWKDLLIPMLGSICIPLLILLLTWLFGYKWQERQKNKRERIEKLSYLRSLMYYLAQTFLSLHELVNANYALISHHTCLRIDEEIKFLPSKDMYSQFDPSKYVDFLEYCPLLVTHLLDVKAFLTDIFVSINQFNSIIENDKNLSIGHVNPILKNILRVLLLKFPYCVDSILEVLGDIDQIEHKTGMTLVQLSFPKNVQKQLNELVAKNCTK